MNGWFLNHTVEQERFVLSAFQRQVCKRNFNGILDHPKADVYWHEAPQSSGSPRSPDVSLSLSCPALLCSRRSFSEQRQHTFTSPGPRPVQLTTQSHVLSPASLLGVLVLQLDSTLIPPGRPETAITHVVSSEHLYFNIAPLWAVFADSHVHFASLRITSWKGKLSLSPHRHLSEQRPTCHHRPAQRSSRDVCRDRVQLWVLIFSCRGKNRHTLLVFNPTVTSLTTLLSAAVTLTHICQYRARPSQPKGATYRCNSVRAHATM